MKGGTEPRRSGGTAVGLWGGALVLLMVAMAAPAQEASAPLKPLQGVLPAAELLADAPQMLDLLLRAHSPRLREQPDSLRRRLRQEVLADFAALDLSTRWRRALQALPSALRREAASHLSAAEVERVRAAQQAPADDDQWQALARYRQRLREQPPRADRRALIDEVVQSSGAPTLVAVLQTGLERLLLARAAAAGVSLPAPAPQEWPWLLRQRREALRELQVEYSFFAYRYLSDEVLRAYLERVEAAPVVAVRDALLRASRAALLPTAAAAEDEA